VNIIHILDNLDRGGAQTSLCRLVAGLFARGYQQHVICLNERLNQYVVDAVQEAGASVEVIGRLRLYAFVGFWHIVRELRRRQPDLVHTELPWGDLIGRTAARIAGTRPIVSTVTGRYTQKPRVQLMLDRATAQWADRVVFVAPEIVPFSVANEGVRPEQVVCIPRGIGPDHFDRAEAAAALRHRYGNGARKIIGMVARLQPPKAHADLIVAFAMLARMSSDLRLWLIGDGPDRQRLMTMVQELKLENHVLFAGDQNNVGDWVAAMDIFVLPTQSEGLPNAVLEAMSAAKPVVATAVDGLRGLITSGGNGWLVAPGDPNALAQTIGYIVDHEEEAERVARAGAKHVKIAFSAEREIGAYDDLFRSLINGRTAAE
jgi:glycosyltransferase involved in cell wall biosynthesis